MHWTAKSKLCAVALVFAFITAMAVADKIYGVDTYTMQYDDYADFKESEIYIPENAHDYVEYVNDSLHAIGIGSCEIRVDGLPRKITVKPAPISLVLIVGQSNAEGAMARTYDDNCENYWNKSILCPKGTVYSTYAPSREGLFISPGVSGGLTEKNYRTYVPESLTDNDKNNMNNRTDKLTNGMGKIGFDSGLAYEWATYTGEKIWVVNAAHEGTAISEWQPECDAKNNEFWQAVNLYNACADILNKEISNQNYKISKQCYFWLQGESDNYNSEEYYIEMFKNMHEGFEKHLKRLGKEKVACGILSVRAALGSADEVGGIHVTKEDLAMTGPRLAIHNITDGSKDRVYLVSSVSEQWVDENRNVERYFIKKYESELNYIVQNPTVGKIEKMPTTIDEVHPEIHYNQQGYNEIGKDAAQNMCRILYGHR